MAIYVKNKEGVMESYKIVGLKGQDGVTPNITIGTVTTLEAGQKATVVNSGTKENPVFNFWIPKGADGTGGSDTSASIDDSIISTNKTWSSAKIENFVLTNNNTIWKDVNGENLNIEYTKEGFLREVEIWGNTIQDQDNLSDIKHLGELYVDDDGKPKLDSQGRQQYKIEVESCNENLFDGELIQGWYNLNKGIYVPSSGRNVCNKNRLRVFPNSTLHTNKKGLMRICEYDKNGIFIKNTVEHERGVILTGNTMYVNIYYDNKGNTNDKVMVSYRPISYIPHKSNKTTILTPCQLSKVGDISDRLYWDSSKGRYVVEKNIGFYNDFSSLTPHKTLEKVKYYFIGKDKITNDKNKDNYGSKDYIVKGFKSVIYSHFYKDEVGVFDSYHLHSFSFPKSTTLDEAKNLLKDSYILYQAKIPELIETNITEELKLPTYINNTYISVNGGIQGSIKAKAPVDGGKVIGALQRENAEIKATNEVQDELINTTMLATDEMYMMLEPLLAEAVNLNERSVSKMVDMYVAMVQRGIKTIDQVPARYREQVKEVLDQLEK